METSQFNLSSRDNGEFRGQGPDNLEFRLLFICCVTLGKSLSASEPQDEDKQLVPSRWDAVEAKSSDRGGCSMHTLSRGYCSGSAPFFLTPKLPANAAPHFNSPAWAPILGPSAAGSCLPPVHECTFILTWPHPPDGEQNSDKTTTQAW